MSLSRPVGLDGWFGDSFNWIAHVALHQNGNRPGTPASRAGIVTPEAVQAEVNKLNATLPPATTLAIGGVPMDQVIMLGGFALAVLVLTGKRRR